MGSSTLLLDTVTNDLVLDAGGNIAVASPPYSLAQDAASSMKLFQGEAWYDVSLGVPYWQNILGQFPPLSLVKAKLSAAALTVPGVTSATVYITGFANRQLSGQCQVTDSAGNVSATNF